jgi:histidine ammonia-lyase
MPRLKAHVVELSAADRDGLTRVVAIEMMTAARALDLRRPLVPAPATGAVVDLLRARGVPGPGPDRHLSPEIEACVELVRSGAVLGVVEEVIGELQ